MITYDELQRLYLFTENRFRLECLEKGLDQDNTAQIHICAVKAMFQAFWEHNYFSNEALYAIAGLPAESSLYTIIIAPYLKIIDDKELIADKYATMYLHYFSKKLEGLEDDVALAVLFQQDGRRAAGAVT